MQRQRGLTLVELLVALGIFALVSAASTAVLSLAVSGRDQLEAANDELRRVERARSLLRADLAQLAPRPVRGAEGVAEPAFAGGDAWLGRDANDEETLLVLTRTGWDNPNDLYPRAELQRVTYLFTKGALIRRTRPYLDAAPATPNQDQTLLSGLTAVTVAFHNGTEWRPGFVSSLEGGGSDGAAPRAVRITLDHPAHGRVDHDFLTGPA